MLGSAIGINKKRRADIAWLYIDSSSTYPLDSQEAVNAINIQYPICASINLKLHYN